MRLRRFGLLLLSLATALVVNTVLGPLGFGVIDYPISQSLTNQLIGLEIVSVWLVVPLLFVAGVLALRGRQQAGVLALAPCAYTVYMFVQYVLGPEYGEYTAVAFMQLCVFTLSGGLLGWSWALAGGVEVPSLTRARELTYGLVLLALATFVVSRYLGSFAGLLGSSPIPAEFSVARTFYWSIYLLDLGVVVPITVTAGIGLIRGSRAAHAALYGVVGWFSLVPPSVASMALVMLVSGDPNASAGQVLLLTVASLVFGAFAAYVYRPLLAMSRPAATSHKTSRASEWIVTQ
jgi:hypothetical protein